MKDKLFICILILSVLLCSATYAGIPITVENYSFEEPGKGKITGWEDVPGWYSDGVSVDSGVEDYGAATDGTWTAYLMAGDPSIYNITTHIIGAEEVFVLIFDAGTTWSDSGITHLTATLFYDDNGTRVPAASEEFELNWYPFVEYTMAFMAPDVPEAAGHPIGIEFINSGTDGWLGLDNIRLELAIAYNQNPANGAVRVSNVTDLTWDLVPPYTVDVYFGTDANGINLTQLVSNASVEIADPGILDYDETYYWRIDGYSGATLYPGALWSFTTASGNPEVLEQPVPVTVESGDTAVFTVDAFDVESYAWYKDDAALTNTGKYSGVDTPSLTISDVQLAEEGIYKCLLTNPRSTLYTDAVPLVTKRLVAHWSFDETLVDSEMAWTGDYVDPNLISYTPVYDSNAISGTSLLLTHPERFVDVADSADFFNFYPNGVTVAAWVNCKDTGLWKCVAAKEDRETWIGWALNYNGSDAAMVVRQASGDILGTTDIDDDKWHFIVGSFDGEVVKTYVDGVSEGQSGSYGGKVDINGINLLIGSETPEAFDTWEGRIDELSIWTYAVDPYDIALMYTDVVTDAHLCVEYPPFDYSGDCIVGLEDFAIFAETWMDCNLIPDCADQH